jgi:hypothetical protein
VVRGLRQADGDLGTIGETPGATYKDDRVDRLADLTMDEHGEATGTVTMSYRGAAALHWRQNYLRGDETSLKRDLQTSLENLMPGGMDIKVNSIQSLEDYEQPLIVKFDVKGQIASSTGKRLLVPADLFVANEKPTFPHEKRELPVYFNYPSATLDAVRVKFPASLVLESAPAAQDLPYEQRAAYQLKSEPQGNSVTVRRTMMVGDIMYSKDEFSKLRAFYNQLESKDQEPVILKVSPHPDGGN